MTPRILHFSILLTLLSTALVTRAAESKEADAARAALKQMCQVAKDKPADLGKHIVPYKAVDGVAASDWQEYVQGRHERVARLLKDIIASAEVTAVKHVDNVACLACIESPGDLDPILLVRKDGVWRISPSITKLKPESMDVSKEEVAAAEKLMEWFDAYSEAYVWPEEK